jgi:hypothetical protein
VSPTVSSQGTDRQPVLLLNLSSSEECRLLGCYTALLVTANVPRSPILVTLMMEAPVFFETSLLTRATRRNSREDAILHSYRIENPKSYKSSFVKALTSYPHLVRTYIKHWSSLANANKMLFIMETE